MNLFWERVDSLLIDGQNLKWVCKELDLNYKSLINMRVQERLPTLENGVKIAKLLGTSVEFLLTGEEPYYEEEEDVKAKAKSPLEEELETLILEILKKHNVI